MQNSWITYYFQLDFGVPWTLYFTQKVVSTSVTHWMERHMRMSKVRAFLLNKLKANSTGKCNNSEFNEAQ